MRTRAAGGIARRVCCAAFLESPGERGTEEELVETNISVEYLGHGAAGEFDSTTFSSTSY